MKTIILQFAMRLEAKPFLEHFKPAALSSPKPQFPFLFSEARMRETRLIFALAGAEEKTDMDLMGTVPAGLLADTAIREFKPDLLINAGTAGGFIGQGARIGEVYLGKDYVAFHSRRFPNIPHWDEVARGCHPVFDTAEMARALGLPRAIVSSGDALDCAPEDMNYIQRNRASLKEMEVAAIGWVCERYGVPLLPIKAVTDFVDHPEATHAQFFANYEVAVSRLFAESLRVLSRLTG